MMATARRPYLRFLMLFPPGSGPDPDRSCAQCKPNASGATMLGAPQPRRIASGAAARPDKKVRSGRSRRGDGGRHQWVPGAVRLERVLGADELADHRLALVDHAELAVLDLPPTDAPGLGELAERVEPHGVRTAVEPGRVVLAQLSELRCEVLASDVLAHLLERGDREIAGDVPGVL